MSDTMLDKAEERIAQLEAERDRLRAELTALEGWRKRVREAVSTDGADCCFCCCGACDDD